MLKGYLYTYTEFNRISLLKENTTFLRAWYLLRAQQTDGCGWITRETALRVLGTYYTQRGLVSLLKSGEWLWWQTDGDILHIKGIRRITDYLGTTPGARVLLPEHAFTSLQSFKAHIYSTYFAREPKILSRVTIEKLFGISERTQIRYEKIAKIKVVKQKAYTKIFEGTLFKLPIADRLSTEEKRGVWSEDIDKDGELELVWQIANRYEATIPLFDKNINGRFSAPGGSDISDGAEPAKKQRIYYKDVKEVARKLNTGQIGKEGVYLLQKKHGAGLIHEYVSPISTTNSATH